MVSWVVNPSSGNAPYVFTAVFKNKNLIDGVNYSLEARYADSFEACVTDPNIGILDPSIASAVLTNNGFTRTGNLESGLCASFALNIINLSNNVVIDSAITYIDNL